MNYTRDDDMFETDTLPPPESLMRRSPHFKYSNAGAEYGGLAEGAPEKISNATIVGTTGGFLSGHLKNSFWLLDASQNASVTVIWSSLTRMNETANTFSISQLALNPSHTVESEPPKTIVVGTPDPLRGYEKYAAPNWDGFGACPISAETMSAARKFLKVLPMSFGAPDIAPGCNGTIAFEWNFVNRPLRKLFIDIGPGALWSAYWRKATGEKTTLPHKPIHAGTADAIEKLFQELNK